MEFEVKVLCHREGEGAYKLIPKQKMLLDLDKIEKNAPSKRRPNPNLLIVKKDGVNYTFTRKGIVIVEGVTPDSPEQALKLVKEMIE